MKMALMIILCIAAMALLLFGCATTRKGYESAKYTLVLADGAMEIRDYPALIVAQTPMPEAGNQSQNNGFMNLFRYISGQNEGQQKIAMTTPVLVVGTASRSAPATNAAMAFVMPAKYALNDLPRPVATNVALRRVEAARYATRRFTGLRHDALLTRETEALLRWMEARQLVPLDTPFFAFYDPPWTPGFLRRNEVLVRIPSPPAP